MTTFSHFLSEEHLPKAEEHKKDFEEQEKDTEEHKTNAEESKKHSEEGKTLANYQKPTLRNRSLISFSSKNYE